MRESLYRCIALVLALALASPVAAQERPTVFVHGLNGSQATWQPAADRLGTLL
jgi:pimeloyl-ACP methyl ester carboxylesterase